MKRVLDIPLSRRRLVAAAGGAAIAGTGLGSQRAAAQDFAGKTVRVCTIDGELSNGVEAQTEAFEAATGATLELIKVVGTDFQTKVTTDLASGVGAFDVVIEPFIFLHGHAAGGFYEPLDDMIAADATIDIPDFVPLLFENMALYQGKTYGLPYKADAYLYFYRTDLLADEALIEAFAAQNNGAELKVPTTAEEAVATARFFTKEFNPDSPTDFGWSHMAMAGGSATWIVASRLAALGGSYLTPEFQPNFDNDAGREAMALAIQLNECCPPDVASYGWEEANTAFLTGKVAMMEQWPGLAKIAETEEGFWGTSEVIGKVGYGVLPGATVDGSLVQSSILGGWAGAVSTMADDKELAFATIAWLTGKEGEVLKIPSGNDPCRTSTYENPEISNANPIYPTLLDSLANSRITADVDAPPVGLELQTIMGDAFNRVWGGDLGGDEALTQVSEQWTEILERANLAT
jgi:multiple sugar transport system substrate-binding protein